MLIAAKKNDYLRHILNLTGIYERLPLKLWLDDLEKGALEQAQHLAN